MNRFARVLFIVIATAGLLLPAVPASAGGGCHGAPLTDERTDEVKTAAGCFVPTVARVGVGDTVTFFNGDEMEHNVTGVPVSFSAVSKNGDQLLPETRAAFRFDEPGVYPYVCTLHPMMAGAIVVGDGEPAAGAAAVGSAGGGDDADQAAAAAAPAADEATTSTGASVAWRPAAAIIVALALAALITWALRARRQEPEPHLG